MLMRIFIAISSAMLLSSAAATAADAYRLSIRDHLFEPARLEVPAGKKIRLRITNHDTGPEEFHSDRLRREKIVLGGKEVSVFIGPLTAGEYPFMGEFHQSSAKGVIVAK